MAIRFECKCEKQLRAPNIYAGTRANCPFCGQTLVIPADAEDDSDHGISFVDDPNSGASAEAERSNVIEFLDPPNAPSSTPESSKPIWIQRMLMAMLDPRSIQWMLTLGGGLMVLGLIVYLASIGVFENERILAGFLITGSFSIMAAGCVVYMRTKYKMAGQALTFLSCILVPLNLWFLHTHGLITISGNLWMGGLVCCVLYIAIVYVLRDPLFMYAVEGGVTLTTVLFLANLGLASDAAYLVMVLLALGAVSIHAERLLPRDAEVFSRRRFGLPLFWCGHAQMGVALLVLMTTQILGGTFGPVNLPFSSNWISSLLKDSLWVPGVMWIVAAYVYLYSYLFVRRVAVNLFLSAAAACAALWQFMGHLGVDASFYAVMYATVGMGMLVAARHLGLSWTERSLANGAKFRCLDGRGLPAYYSANTILTAAFTSATLRGLMAVWVGASSAGPLAALSVTLLICIACAVVVPGGAWRGLYGAFAAAMVGTLVLRFTRHLSALQVLEIFFVAAGLLLLVRSYIDRFKESREGENESLSYGLWFGSLLSAMTLLIVALYHRLYEAAPSLPDELALVTVSILMLWTGVVWQLKAPTIIGGLVATVYLVVLVSSLAIFPEATVGVYLAVGGCLLFALGVSLSVYRDRLVELPTRIANRQGVFQIMNWR